MKNSNEADKGDPHDRWGIIFDGACSIWYSGIWTEIGMKGGSKACWFLGKNMWCGSRKFNVPESGVSLCLKFSRSKSRSSWVWCRVSEKSCRGWDGREGWGYTLGGDSRTFHFILMKWKTTGGLSGEKMHYVK